MSTGKNKKVSGRGGARPGAGHPKTGITKKKICVSVTETLWDTAVSIWRKQQSEPRKSKSSQLVNVLVTAYAKTDGGILKMEAAI
ncbi:MAG TPA: hypothetical protein VH619_18695 [Verrucomicrobiae bacterium]|jgi:hypothetical protein|nr:hypothetical protein [Verrucomicrobiae bacterium]